MKFLFFDIECSNGHDICSFGYVLSDKNFNIIKKEDIIINPESNFILSAHGHRPKISLAYPKKVFLQQPSFPFFYDKIKTLIEDDDTTVMGHSILSDMHFLYNACERYKLKPILINGYDTQKLFHLVYKTEHLESLEKILEQLNISYHLQFHKSSDDAEGVYLVAKTLFNNNNLTMTDLKTTYKETFTSSDNIHKKSKQEKFIDKVNEIRQNHCFSTKKAIIKVAFSEEIKHYPMNTQLEIVMLMFKKNYDFTPSVKLCKKYVTNATNSKRDEFAQERLDTGSDLDIVDYKDFFDEIHFKNKI